MTTINANSAEIESIVRRVLATLTNGATSLSSVLPPSALPMARLSLLDNVISVQSLKDRIRGFQVLEIGASAVITPAARDFCNELQVEVVRGKGACQSKSDAAPATRLQRLLVAGTPPWMPAIAKQLCKKQAAVCDTAVDDSSALRTIADGLRAGHQAAVAIVNSPHAVCWQAARDDRLRPAVLTNWNELNDVLGEVPANLLILSARTWNVASACNSARRFYQHLQKQS